MRIGIVASSGGGVFREARRLLMATQTGRHSFLVATDRPCGVETFCEQEGIRQRRIVEPDNRRFSETAASWFDAEGGVDVVLLFYLRLVTDALFVRVPTLNLHPSLLPAFAGFRAIDRAVAAGSRFLGATLHLVNADTDAGPIIGQVCAPLRGGETRELLDRMSFFQKLHLFLLAIDLLERRQLTFLNGNSGVHLTPGLPCTDRCSPRIMDDRLWTSLLDYQRDNGVDVIR